MNQRVKSIKTTARKAVVAFQAALLVAGGILPFMMTGATNAAQLTNRSAGVTTARPGQSFDVTFTFRLASSSVLQGMEFEFCDTPLGTCATTQTPTVPAGSTVSQNGNWTAATAWGTYTRQAGRNGGANNQIRVERTSGTTEAQSGSNDRTVTFTGLTNFGTANKSYYPRIRLYSDNTATTFTTLVHDGAVAQSTSQTLTVNARVQEVLSFCIGSTTVDDATSSIVADCSSAAGTSVDLGVVTSTAVSTTPVAPANNGDNKNGYAMVLTNAQNGVVIGYNAVQDTSSGKLKVTGAACSGTSTTDQCFNSQGATQGTFTAGTEKFGMTIAGVNCNSVPVAAYSCVYATGTTNLQPLTNYIGGAYTNGTSGTYGATSGFAWVDTGASVTNIASSASSAVKVVATMAYWCENSDWSGTWLLAME